MVSRKKQIKPVLKWAGGKRQLIKDFMPLLPDQITSYCEPFLGGGALLFHLQPNTAYINDINTDLMCVYTVIRDNVEELIEELKEYKNDYYLYHEIREWDRDRKAYNALPAIKKAARIIYLNKTCYNGLFRVNMEGQFNVNFGYYENPKIVDETALREVSKYLNTAMVHISSGDFAQVLRKIEPDTFVYLDPPYDPLPGTPGFDDYTPFGFGRLDQFRLAECCHELNARGVKFMLSNAATPFVLKLYEKYHITMVKAKRSINSNGKKRGRVDEVVIRNYE